MTADLPPGTASMPGDSVVVVRSEAARIGSVIWAVTAALLTADVLRRGEAMSLPSRLALVDALALVSVAVFACAWRPQVRLDDRALVFVNPLRTITIPWPAVTSVGGKWSLVVRTVGGHYTPWVSGPRSRRDVRKGVGPGLSAAIATRWEQASVVGSGAPTQPAVEWQWRVVAVVAVLGAVLVGLVLGG